MRAWTRARALVAAVLIGVLCGLEGCSGTGPTSPSPEVVPPPPPPPGPNALDALLAACPSAADIVSVQKVPLHFLGEAADGPRVCAAAEGSADLNRTRERVYQALIQMRRLRFSQALPWTDRPLYDWFTSLVGGIEFRPDASTSFCCAPGNVIVIKLGTWTGGVTWPGIETMISAFVHEARHIEFGPHTCGIRDRTIAEMGAFGVHNYFFQWVGRYSDPSVVPVEYRSEALWKACTQANSAFCGEPHRDCSRLQ